MCLSFLVVLYFKTLYNKQETMLDVSLHFPFNKLKCFNVSLILWTLLWKWSKIL